MVFKEDTGTGSNELGEMLVGVISPDLELELCIAPPWGGWELVLCEGGNSGCACRGLWILACGMGKIDVFVVGRYLLFGLYFEADILGPGILK